MVKDELKYPTRYYVEALVAVMEDREPEIRVNVVIDENKFGIRNDEDIILVKERQFTKFYFMILDDLYLSIKPIEERAKTKAMFYYLAFKHYSFVLTCDEHRNLHFIHTLHNAAVDKDDDVVFIITYFNGYREEPLHVAKFNLLRYEMDRLNKKYGPTRAYPLNFSSFNTAIYE